MTFVEFIIQFKYILIFYALVAIVIYLNRSKFEFHAKFIGLYRTKIGVPLMNALGKRYEKIIRVLGYIGVPLGFIGMAVILFFIAQGVFNLFFVPNAPPTVSPVLPGLPIPGTGITVPLIEGLLALFFVVVIHEFSHGLVARSHNLPIKSSGFAFFGPLPGAFVEPDEKKLKKQRNLVQLSVFAAGPFSNILTAALVLLIFLFIMDPIAAQAITPEGVIFTKIVEGAPAAIAGIPQGTMITEVNGNAVNSTQTFFIAMQDIQPGQNITIAGPDAHYGVMTAQHPLNASRAYLGIEVKTQFRNEKAFSVQSFLWITTLLNWIFILSLGLGLANLLPLGPVDGGRMFHIVMLQWFGEQHGNRVWMNVSMVLLYVLLLLLLIPVFKAILPF